MRRSKLMPSTRSNSTCARSCRARIVCETCLGPGLRRRAVALLADRLQRLLEHARVVLGDHHMAFLVPLDVGRQRVPDQPDVLLGAARPRPARQDDLGLDRHAGLGDDAPVVALGVADPAGEFHLCGAWMAPAGRLDLGAANVELLLDLLQRRAADRKIAVCLGNARSAGGPASGASARARISRDLIMARRRQSARSARARATAKRAQRSAT